MDSDYEERSRDEELSKLRSCSASPSALSTASSGSPLVRGSSGGSANKRPAPTSIAAAQLQCQQQRQLEFANQVAGLTGVSSGGGSKKSSSSKQQWQLPAQVNLKPPSYSSQARANQWTTKEAAKKATKPEKAAGKSPADSYDETKSRGYNVAKSIAYRAYRFNEFWSVNKMRYMNLACLLMTLLCLVTILLLSNGNSATNNSAALPATGGKTLQEKLAARKQPNDDGAESFDSLDSQPLQSSLSQQVSAPGGTNDNQLFDDFSLFSGTGGKFRRKSESDKTGNSIEREVDESAAHLNSPDPDPFERPAVHTPTGGSLIDLLLGQLFSNDIELGSLYKAIRRAANGTNQMSPPVIRRSKNGATIIISSSSLGQKALNESGSSLLDKLLPPIFRPISSLPGTNLTGPPGAHSGVATITIGAEPIFAAGSSGIGRLLGPFGSLDGPSTGRGSLFMEPMGFRSPFGPMFSPPPMAFPPPSLLSMMMRSANSLDDQMEPPSGSFSAKVERVPAPGGSATGGDKSADKNDTLTTQASQQVGNTTAPKDSTKSIPADPDVETFDLSRPYRMSHNFYPRPRPSAGSMLVFSSGGSGESASRDSFPFPPFMALPPPQMMLIGSAGGSGGPLEAPSGVPLNPILKSILSNVMSDLSGSPADQLDKNKTDRNSAPRTPRTSSSNNVPHWSSLPELDSDDWPAGGAATEDRWDEQAAQSKHLRARHRDEDADSAAEASDFVTGLQLDQSQGGSPFGSMLDSGIISGTIRQTIRGPGMSVERIIEVPSSRVQHVAAGVRSQSLSRADSDEENSRPTLISGSPFMMRDNRMDRDDFGGPVPLGFISRLLSDISRRSDQPPRSQVMKSRALDDDLDEGDSSSQAKHQDGWPKVRLVGGVRIKTHRPVGVAHPNAVVMPANHFSSPSADLADDGKESAESKLGSSFEDTMNSMEDRLNHVLSVASQHTLSSNHKQSEDSEVSVKPSGIVPVQRNHQAPTIAGSVETESANKQSNVDSQPKQPSGNPFTSPSSPLFGFPASSIIQQATSETKNKQQVANSSSNNLGGSRQQRSFTYHSNNELAASVLPAPKATISEPIARSRFIPLQSPPAGVVMGRRLDDGPIHESTAANQQHHNHQAVVPAAFEDRNKLFGEARGFMSSASANGEGFRTIVV